MSQMDEREIKRRFEAISEFEVSPEVAARDMRRARETLLEEIARQPATRRRVWSIVVGSRITKLAAAVVIIALSGYYLFFGNGQANLYAQVKEAFEQARTIYAIGHTFEEGGKKKVHEMWYQRGLGLRTETGRHGKTRTNLDNGLYEWQYVQGNDFAVQTESRQKMWLPGEITEPSRYLKKCTREPVGDIEVDGSACMLYTRTHPAQAGAPVVKSMMWIDEKMRFRQYEEQQLLAGTWQTTEVVSISYDIQIDPRVFVADFGPEVRILKAQDSIENLFPLEGALAAEEVMGLVFAVHELSRSGDYIFTTVSLRPTDDTRNQLRSYGSPGDEQDFKHYGDIGLSSWWQRKANGEIEKRPYAHTMLAYYQVDDVLVRCFTSLPKADWPGVDDQFELSVGITPMGKLRDMLREKGRQSRTQAFKPLFRLPLPADDTPVEQIASNLYETAKLVAHLRPNRLEPRPADITSEEFAAEVERKLTGLRPMTELWQEVGSEVTLKLLDEDGRPVAGASIGGDIRSLDGRLYWYSQNERRDCAVSDADGKVALQGQQMFEPGASRQRSRMLVAVQEQMRLAGMAPITDEDFGRTVTLTMQPACRVHGRFVCPELSDSGDALNRPVKTHLSFFAEKMMYRILYHTTDRQVFEALLVPGKYSMSCESRDADRKWIARAGQLLDVPKGEEELDLGEIVLRLEDYR